MVGSVVRRLEVRFSDLGQIDTLAERVEHGRATGREGEQMASMKETAERFFDACDTGEGWAGCQEYCHEGATFSAQTGAL